MKIIEVNELAIPAVKTIRFQRFVDHRGYFTEHFRQSDFEQTEATAALMEREASGLFHLTNEGECSWHEFASATVELAGIDVPVEPTASTQLPRRARRPPYSALTSERLATAGVPPLRPWREALAHYLRAKGLAA